MNYRHLLKFYFFADGLNGAMDALTVRLALASSDCSGSCICYADRIGGVIEAKCKLNELWLFLDNALSSVTDADRIVLKAYSLRRGVSKGAVTAEAAKAEHRALMKLSRRIGGRLAKYAEQVNVLREYYCLIG